MEEEKKETKSVNKRENKKKRQVSTWVLILGAIICIVIGVFVIKDSFLKMNRAAGYSEKILNLFTNAQKK